MGNIRVWLFAVLATLLVSVGNVCLANPSCQQQSGDPNINNPDNGGSIPSGMETISYTGTFTPSASGGTVANYVWTVTGLPSGMSFNSGTGEITGAPDDGEGGQTYPITFVVDDGPGPNDSVTANLYINDRVEFTTSGDIGTATVGAIFS